jgi:F-type H+-transporting ATPase subunit gamma
VAGQLRVYRRRIKSVNNIKKITRAMELIATSRIAKSQVRVQASRPYAESIREVIRATADQSGVDHPLVSQAEDVRRAAVVVMTSDRGLAGGYSANALRTAEGLLRELGGRNVAPDVYAVGRKAVSFYSFRNRELAGSFTGFTEEPSYADAKRIAAPVLASFSGEEDARQKVDEIYIVSTAFTSMLSQRARVERVLPLDAQSADESDGDGGSGTSDGPRALYDFEPSAEDVLDALLPRYVESTIYAHLLEAAASESAARRRAMKSATDNADDLIKSLTRQANTARQAEITQEISEIVGGANALAAR